MLVGWLHRGTDLLVNMVGGSAGYGSWRRPRISYSMKGKYFILSDPVFLTSDLSTSPLPSQNLKQSLPLDNWFFSLPDFSLLFCHCFGHLLNSSFLLSSGFRRIMFWFLSWLCFLRSQFPLPLKGLGTIWERPELSEKVQKHLVWFLRGKFCGIGDILQ